MTIYAFTSLLAFIVSLSLGLFIFFKDSKSSLNRVYFMLSVAISQLSLVEFGYRQSHNFEEASFWWHLDVLWSLHAACWFHFAAVFTEKNKWQSSRLFYLLLYGPVVAFAALDVFGNHITGPPVRQSWGWTYGIRDNLLNSISFLWLIAVCIFGLILVIHHYRGLQNIRKIKQTRLIILSALIPLLMLLTELLIRDRYFIYPSMVGYGFIVVSVLIGYAIWKYELFNLTPSSAAESIIATMNDSLILAGLDGKIISSNQATARILGYPGDGLTGKPVSTLFRPGAVVPEWIQENAPDNVSTVRSKNIETEYQTAEGSHIPVSLSGSILRDDDGNIRGYLLIARDITEQKKAALEIIRHRDQLEELIQQRTKQLSKTNVKLQDEINERQKAESEKRDLQEQLYQAQKLEAIGRLAGGVAHDFNNLLFVINGYAETLIDDLKDDPRHRADVHQILEAGTRAVNLTRQLLAFSRKQIIDPVLVDINDRIGSSCQMLSRMIGEDIQIEFNSTLKSGKVIMDITQLDQIIANLLVNARDAMPTGGRIQIRTESYILTESDAKNYPNRRPGHYVLIRVTDTGCGIEPKKLKMIFEPFYTSKEVGKGTGLGLATVYGIVTQNKGFIEVDSRVNVGTEFRIYLSRAGATTSNELALDSQPGHYPGTETVLLVEDEHLVRRLAKRQLESAGYRVLQAIDAQTGLDIFYRFERDIDVLLTDVVMPGMSGVQMVEKIVQHAHAPKIVFMSGHNEEIMNKHGIRKTQFPLLAKPFTSQQLCEKIREAIDSSGSRIQASHPTYQ
jgi:PAS domain S-box-containing protein